MADFQGFSSDTFGFLEALAIHNNRKWFEAHRADYESLIVAPSLALITDMAYVISSISPHYQALAKKTGGSLMRIYRDTRFSRDKTPYKTNIGIQFRHERGNDAHAPGFYVHLAVDECFSGAGTWHPEPTALRQIRQHIANHPDEYTDAVQRATGTTGLNLYGDALKKVPKGFDPSHPLASEIRRIDFLVSGHLAPELYLDRSLVAVLEQRCRTAAPFMRFLCHALGVEF